jgi:hypothetical protein
MSTKANAKETEQWREELEDFSGLEKRISTMRLGPTVDLSRVSLIAKNITLPDDPLEKLPLSRFADDYTATPTAAARPLNQQIISIAGATDGKILSNPDFVAILKRDPVVNTIQYEANVGKEVYLYDGYFPTEGTVNDASITPSMTKTPILEVEGGRWLCPGYMNSVNKYSPHGPKLYGQRQKSGAYYFYATAGHGIFLGAYNTTSGTVQYGFQIYRDFGGTDVEVGSTMNSVASGGAMNYRFFVPTSGYYAARVFMAVTGTTPCAGQITYSIANVPSYPSAGSTQTGISTMAHKPCIDFDQNAQRVSGIRVLAGSLMLTNFTNLYQVVGVMSGSTIPGARSWIEMLDAGSAAKLIYGSTTKLIGQENSENGMRGWIKPCSAADYEILENVTYRNGVLIDAHADLYTTSNYLMLYYQNQSSSALQIEMMSSLRFEYYTQDNWTEQRIPTAIPDEWAAAHEIIKEAPTITANPIHWYAIAKSILGGLKKYSGKVGKAIGNFAGTLDEMF